MKKKSYMISSVALTKKKDTVSHCDAKSEFKLGKRFGEMILQNCY